MGLDQLENMPTSTVGPAVWDWMGDVEVSEEDEDKLAVMVRNPTRISAAVAEMLPSDDAVFASLRGTALEDVSEETRDTIDFLLDDFDLESELKAIPDADQDEELVLPEVSSAEGRRGAQQAGTHAHAHECAILCRHGVHLPQGVFCAAWSRRGGSCSAHSASCIPAAAVLLWFHRRRC